MRKLVYFAGPDLFFGCYQGKKDAIRRMCEARDIYPLFPGDDEISDSKVIFRENVAKIREAHLLIANLNPFRSSVEPDSGTAFECGLAWSSGIPVIGVCLDRRPMMLRIDPATHLCNEDGLLTCSDGAVIENFGFPVNLMLATCTTAIVATVEDAINLAARLELPS